MNSLFIYSVLFTISLWNAMAGASEQGFTARCDLLGTHLKSLKSSNQKECWDLCLKDTKCNGAVFVSGWKRCFLKESVKRQAKLRFYSGEKGQEGRYDLDYTGKDLKRHVVATKEQCVEECNKEQSCTGYTYLEGYRDCWVKNTKGKLFEKIFYCQEKGKPPTK